MMVIARAVVRLCGLNLLGQRRRPFLPREVSFFREPHCQGERLCFPGFGENRSLRLLQGTPPTNPDARYPAAKPARPTIPAPQNAPSTRVVGSRLCRKYAYREKPARRDRIQSPRLVHEHTEAIECGLPGEYYEHALAAL